MGKAVGSWGEKIAAKFLKKRGFFLLGRNLRFKYKEIDIVALEGRELVFVEVKTRHQNLSKDFSALSAIDDDKISNLTKAAENFIKKYAPKLRRLAIMKKRIDVVEIEYGNRVGFLKARVATTVNHFKWRTVQWE